MTNAGIGTLESVTGNHLSGKSNADVEYLYIHNQILTRFPTNIEAFFPFLIGIEWFNSNLLSIAPEDLEPFENLVIFSSFMNKLVSIDGRLFERAPKLRWISFYGNLIENVGYNLLENLPDLQYVSFGSNPCIDTIALTPNEIAELKVQLLISCPPIGGTTTTTTTTTTPQTTSTVSTTPEMSNECPSDCVDRIGSSEFAIFMLNQKVTDMYAEIAVLRDLVLNQSQYPN